MRTHKLQEKLTILSLLEELSETNATVQQILCGLVQVGAKLRESSHLTVLSQLQLHGASHLYTHHKTWTVTITTAVRVCIHCKSLSYLFETFVNWV